MPMPSEAAAGPLTLAEEYLAATFCASARFQTMLGVASAAMALARCYIDALPTPTDGGGDALAEFTVAQLTALRPFLLIGQPPRQSYRRERVATDAYAEAGSFVCLIELTVADADREDMSLALRKIKNHIGVMLTEMDAFAWLPGYLAIERVTVDGPFRCEDDEVNTLGDHVYVLLTVFWNGGLSA